MSTTAQASSSAGGASARMKASVAQLRSWWAQDSVPFLTAYVVSGLLALIVPAAKYHRSVKSYQNSYYYQYQQQNQSGDNDNGQQQGNYDINNCRWYQWNCTPQYVNENGEYVDYNDDNNNNNQDNNNNQNNNNNYYATPSWFSGWSNGNGSGDGASGDSSANSAALKFVYAWQVILFLGVLVYGALILYKFRAAHATVGQAKMAMQSLFLVLFLWTNTTFMAMWLLANGSISTEEREMEDAGGFYNQFSVMMFLTNFWYTIWGIFFCLALGIQLCRGHRASSTNANSIQNNKALPGDSMNYLPYCEPSITVTGVDKSTTEENGVKASNYGGFFS